MKKLKLSLIIVLTLAAVLVPTQALFAATTAQVTVNVTPQRVSITIYDHTGAGAFQKWTVNPIYNLEYALSTDNGTAMSGQADQFAVPATGKGYTIKNNSATSGVNTSIKGHTHDTWTLTAGAKTDASPSSEYALWFAKVGDGSWTNMTVNYVTFKNPIAASSFEEFYLSMQAPSDWNSYSTADYTIATVLASKP